MVAKERSQSEREELSAFRKHLAWNSIGIIGITQQWFRLADQVNARVSMLLYLLILFERDRIRKKKEMIK